jgi:hypothetical protein
MQKIHKPQYKSIKNILDEIKALPEGDVIVFRVQVSRPACQSEPLKTEFAVRQTFEPFAYWGNPLKTCARVYHRREDPQGKLVKVFETEVEGLELEEEFSEGSATPSR